MFHFTDDKIIKDNQLKIKAVKQLDSYALA
jgi:hypothetical protein